MVNYNEYGEVKEGDREDTLVKEILEGKAKEFFGDKYFEGIKKAEDRLKAMESLAVKIVCENGADLSIMLPYNKIFGPKSKFTLWKKTYGSYPAIGQKVSTKVDSKGYRRIVLEV